MTKWPSMACLAFAVALPGAVPGGAAEPGTTLEPLWAPPPGAAPGCTRLLMMEAPRDWMAGDAAVVVLAAAHAEEDLAARVTEALLVQQAAVVRLRVGLGGGIGNCSAAAADPVTELLGTLDALRRQAGAGLVVAIGLGTLGPTVLAATEEATAARILGPGGSRLAAGMAMGGEGPALFHAGAAPPTWEHWEARVPHLCTVLAPLAAPGAGAACLDSLTRQGEALASLRPPR